MKLNSMFEFGLNFLIVGMLVAIVILFKKLINNERKRKSFYPSMQPGDSVRVPVITNSIDGEIIEVGDEFVTIKTQVPKSRVYPK